MDAGLDEGRDREPNTSHRDGLERDRGWSSSVPPSHVLHVKARRAEPRWLLTEPGVGYRLADVPG